MPDDLFCGAKTRSGGTCRRRPMAGCTRCDMHGGKSPNAQRKARERLAQARAERALADLGETEPVTDPIGALEQLGGVAVRLVEILQTEVSKLEKLRYEGGLGTEQIRGELSAFMSALGRAESILGRIMSLDLESRRVRLQEAQAALVVKAFAKVLGHQELGLAAELQRRGRVLLEAELARATPATATEVIS